MSILTSRSFVQNMWISKSFHDTQAFLWGKLDNFRRFVTLKKENERLSEMNVLLSGEIESLKSTLASRDTNWQSPYPRIHFRMMNANVVTSQKGSQHNYIIIDKGSADGVEVDDGLMTRTGVIGIVQRVSENFAYALTYANSNMVVSAKMGRDGYVGSMSWDGYSTDRSILSGIPIHIDVEYGDTVFTSGYSSIFPSDIPLGIVIGSKSIKGSSSDITVSLFDDYSRLNRLMVVKNMDSSEINELKK